MNGVGFEILARTPVPKLPLSYPPRDPCKPQLYYIKVEFQGSKLYRYVFVMPSLAVELVARIQGCFCLYELFSDPDL